MNLSSGGCIFGILIITNLKETRESKCNSLGRIHLIEISNSNREKKRRKGSKNKRKKENREGKMNTIPTPPV